ncbi:DUF4129 domain-containing protein [Mycolicibacterium monacense]|uniref:Membrane protein n=4 Tax=Mycobacteriaceae TaxID=1762 RepID=A0AAD1N2F5_MYCMB|nr:DUF4129 domain-containing protein [Mycolicibacterium monacense]MDA4105368.1 membrane protein [Mycolicibacterium monacense DSM 44395]OBB54885.1 hypothetical protein A6B34_08705 [Mycolicibacterium monacense]ORB15727.1 hypothetical protein BST34_20695 [Mycolicibacterium monacense DSM 44395]QHP88574.1 DUF4129 domain-containing protein [Mycolicibacterium monacense DSM 44395]BBZ64000.1 membrane protein [Mycolicibacterium monacense]
MPTVDIDRDAAHEAAQKELDKPIYPRASLTDRLSELLEDLIHRIAQGGAGVPGGWLTISVLVLLILVAVVVAVRIARRAMRTDRGEPSLYGGHELSAAEHRTTAEQYAASGQWALAIRHRLRAIARQLEESGVLTPVPGRTATELANDAGLALPALSDELRDAATAFNDVTYGDRPGTEAAYRSVAVLDDHIRAAGPTPGHASGVPRAATGWAEVR